MSNFFGTVPIVAGTRATTNIGASGLSGVLIGNESGLTVIVTMQGANTSRSLYPGTVDWFPLPARSQFNGNLFFDPTANLNNASSWPSSFVQIDTFGTNEAPSGTYPMALPRNTNVGNSVTTNVTNSTLVYDGAVAGSQFIEATAQGDASSGVTLDNSANLVLGNATHKGSITLKGTLSTDNGLITTDGSGNLTVTTKLIANLINALTGNDFGANVATGHKIFFQVNGTDIVDVTSTGLAVTGKTTSTSMQTDTINDSGGTSWAAVTAGATTRIQAATTLALQIPGGSTQVTVNATDVVSNNQLTAPQFILGGSSGNYRLYQNSLSRLNMVTGTGTGASQTISHGLGATPTACIVWGNSNSSTSTLGTSGYTSTQFNLLCFSNAVPWAVLSMRY